MARHRNLARRCAVLGALLAGFCGSAPALADVPSTFVLPEQVLRFGYIAVFGSGTRTVTPSGGVSDSGGILSAAGDLPGPARFSVGYDRGNEGNKSIDVTMQITFGAIPPVTQGGVTASVSNITSDLPGGATLSPGQTVTITIRGCRVRQCGASFNLGGQLNVSRTWGGAQISTPVPVTVTVTSVN